MGTGIVVAFVVAYASIAWLLRFVATNSLMPFVWYRVALGAVLVVRSRRASSPRPDPRLSSSSVRLVPQGGHV